MLIRGNQELYGIKQGLSMKFKNTIYSYSVLDGYIIRTETFEHIYPDAYSELKHKKTTFLIDQKI